MEDLHLLDKKNRQRIIDCDPIHGPRRLWVKAPAGGGKTTFLQAIDFVLYG